MLAVLVSERCLVDSGVELPERQFEALEQPCAISRRRCQYQCPHHYHPFSLVL
jgi:hypothetical protein